MNTQQLLYKKAPRSIDIFNRNTKKAPRSSNNLAISSIIPEFLIYAKFEKRFANESIIKYQDCFRGFIREVGDVFLSDLNTEHFSQLKQNLFSRGISEARVASVIFSMKSLLNYCKEVKHLKVISSRKIRSPRRPRREVIFLSNEEIRKFIKVIDIKSTYGLRFRTLVEVLLGTGMRISEALSLDRDSIDYAKREVKIIGKGNKERIVFFNNRSLEWIRKYLSERWDAEQPIFITHGNNRRLSRSGVMRDFKRYRDKAGIKKKVSKYHIAANAKLTSLGSLVKSRNVLGACNIFITYPNPKVSLKNLFTEANISVKKFPSPDSIGSCPGYSSVGFVPLIT